MSITCSTDDVLPPAITKDILTNELYGLGLDSAFLDTPVFDATGTYCTTLDLLLSLTFDSKISVIDALELIAGHHLGYFTISTDKIQHKQIKSESSSKTFSRLIDFIESEAPIQVDRRGVRETKNRVNIQYTKRSDNYTTGVEVSNDETHQILNGILEGDIQYQGYNTPERASKVGTCMLARGLFIPREYEFITGIKNLQNIVPGSVVTLSDIKVDGDDVEVRIVSLTENPDKTINVSVIEEIPIYLDDVDERNSSASVYIPPSYGGIVDDVINFGIHELPPLLSAGKNIVILPFSSTGGDNYSGVSIYESWDGASYSLRENSGKDCLTAVVDSTDLNKITLTISNDVTLESVADILALLSNYNKNLCWVEEVNAYFRFTTATLIGVRQWELTDIIWGVYGVPKLNYHEVSAGHTITLKTYGDDPHSLEYSKNYKGQTLYIKPVPFNKRGQLNDISTTPAYSKTFQTDGTRPFIPLNLEVAGYGSATKVTKADLTFQWQSRNRSTFGLDYSYSDQIAEDIDFEQFDWAIYEGSNLLRDGNTTDSNFVYTEVMQTTDGDPTSITFVVNKKSTSNRSYDAEIDIDIF